MNYYECFTKSHAPNSRKAAISFASQLVFPPQCFINTNLLHICEVCVFIQFKACGKCSFLLKSRTFLLFQPQAVLDLLSFYFKPNWFYRDGFRLFKDLKAKHNVQIQAEKL